MTLLEMMIASTLLTAVVAAVGIVLRTGHVAWRAQCADAERIASAHATLRHITRSARQAQSVAAISGPNDTSGALSLLMPSGETYAWAHDSRTGQVLFGVGKADELLAEGIAELRFVGYAGDGTTETSVPEEIRSVKSTVRVELPRQANGSRTVSCHVWVRSW